MKLHTPRVAQLTVLTRPRAAACAALLATSLALLTTLLAFLILPVAAAHAATPEVPKFSAAALYNLGNSYARAGKTGLAVLNYQRAALLDPTDPDLRANLQQVHAVAGFAPLPLTRLDRIAALAAPPLVAWIGLLGLAVTGVCLLAAERNRRQRRRFAAAAVLGVALMGFTLCNALALWPKLHQAVVVSATAPARVSPVPMGEPLFVLREAELVTTTVRHEGYVLVRTGAGREGWVSADNLASVVPPAGGT